MINFISNTEKNNNENKYTQEKAQQINFNSNGNAKDSIRQQYNYTLTWKRQIIIRHEGDE